jgi:hypothetical protein
MTTAHVPTPIRDGCNAALDRVTQAGQFEGEPDAEAQQAAQRTLADAADMLQGEEPDRFVELFAEITAVGAFARARYSADRTTTTSFNGRSG